MTIGGAIAELQNLINADDVPFYYKGGIEKVIETISMEFPTIEVSEDCISRKWLEEHIDVISYTNEWEETEIDECVFWKNIENAPSVVPTTEQSSMVGEWKWESQDICGNCGYEIPHLERIVGETVLMDSKDWKYCPNCGAKMRDDNVEAD